MGKKTIILSEYEESFPSSKRMQCPSNEILFKSPFCPGFTKNDTSILVLKSLYDRDYYFYGDFKYKIKEDMYKCFGKNINNTCGEHRFNNLEYHNLIEKYDFDKVRLTISGRSLIREIISKDCSESECIKSVLSAFTEVKAKSVATKRVSDNIKVYVYRALFYFILKNGFITGEFLTYNFPYITNASILETNPDLNIDLLLSGQFYSKWVVWGIQSLINIGIIKVNFKKVDGDIDDKKFNARISAIENNKDLNNKTKNTYVNYLKKWYFTELYLSPKWKKEVEHYFGHFSVNDLFYSDESYRAGFMAGRKVKPVRNYKIIEFAKKRDNYTCQLTGIKLNWNGADGKTYCELHHILRMYKQAYYLKKYNFDIDIPELTITLHPEIHRKIENAPLSEKKDLLDKLFDDFISDEIKERLELAREEFYKLYEIKSDKEYYK
jgi:hypothetical protein